MIIVEMDRRAFLATAGAAGAVAVVPLPDRVTPDVMTALSDRYDWHVRAGRVMPAETVSRLMKVDLEEISRVAGNVPTSFRPAMLTLASRFAEHLGWMRQEADDTTGALYWTDRAADFAHAAGWRHMASYALSRKAAIVLNTQPRHATELAGLVRKDRRLPAGVIAFAAGKEAEAHARAGNAKGAYEALDLARAAADRIDPDEPLPAPQMVATGALLDARQSRCDLVLGRPEAVITTLAPITAEWITPRSVINYGPPLAIAYAKVGHIDKASRVAGSIARSRQQCGSTGSLQDVRELRSALRPWAGRSDVDDVIAALST
ncbi:MAG TPA: twin-arginine translocation signal domain-containing protein [Mycobacteriales bacterium]|nr:twin-arginine translocation signal domain-containing protein [Mycobacteriales bacterium]